MALSISNLEISGPVNPQWAKATFSPAEIGPVSLFQTSFAFYSASCCLAENGDEQNADNVPQMVFEGDVVEL